jgi:hypothetical protein
MKNADKYIWKMDDITITPPPGKGKTAKKGVKTKSAIAAAAFGAMAADCDGHCTACSSCRAKKGK